MGDEENIKSRYREQSNTPWPAVGVAEGGGFGEEGGGQAEFFGELINGRSLE